MSDINGVYNFNSQITNYLAQFGIDLQSSDAVSQIKELCTSNPDVLVTLSKMAAEQIGQLFGGPLLEPPTEDDETDLEKLIAELQMETDEQQIKRLKEEINAKIGKIKSTYEEQMKKIEESIEKAKKAEKSGTIGRIFSWIGAALAVAAAVVACIATGGVAVGAVIGAVLAVGTLIMEETGATEKLMKAMAESIMKTFGCSKQTAQIWAQVIYMAMIVAVSVTSIVTSAKGVVLGAAKAATQAAQMVELAADAAVKAAKLAEIIAKTGKIMSLITTAITLAQLGVGVSGTVTGYQAAMSQVDKTEIDKILMLIQKRLEEDNEELQKIMDALSGDIAILIDLLESANKAKDKIALEMGSGDTNWA